MTKEEADLLEICCKADAEWNRRCSKEEGREVDDLCQRAEGKHREVVDLCRRADDVLESSRRFREENDRTLKSLGIDLTPKPDDDLKKSDAKVAVETYDEEAEIDTLRSLLTTNPTGRDVDAIGGKISALEDKLAVKRALSRPQHGRPKGKN